MAPAHGTRMRMRGNHRGPLYLYKHICTLKEREGGEEAQMHGDMKRGGRGKDEAKAKGG